MRDEFGFPGESLSFDCQEDRAVLILLYADKEIILPCSDIKPYNTPNFLISEWARAYVAIQQGKMNTDWCIDQHPPNKQVCLDILRTEGILAPRRAN